MSSDGNGTRERILEAAWRLLEAGRGAGVRMGDIAREAGISRQAVYLHFATRAELLVATTRYIDRVKDVETRLASSRAAASGVARLDAFIDAYIPEIYPVAHALLAMKDTDEAARHAWDDRMRAVREGCAAAVEALAADGVLTPDYSPAQATDLLWTLLSVRNWEQLVLESGWSRARYLTAMKSVAHRTFVSAGTTTG